MNMMSVNGEIFDLPMRGPAGPDGSPVGTIISFMGVKAPRDYLICDGSQVNVADYPALAECFKDQFGSEYYFGGSDGQFNLPDLRNMFLRGFHGSAEEQLSGDVGKKQDGTTAPCVAIGTGSFIFTGTTDTPIGARNTDKITTGGPYRSLPNSAATVMDNGDSPGLSYTPRPVNVAVLYCIKAVDPSTGIMEEYDTEIENCRWHVRKYINGYVEMIGNADYSGILFSTNWPWGYIQSFYDMYGGFAFPVKLVEKYSEQSTVYPASGSPTLTAWASSWEGESKPLERCRDVLVVSSLNTTADFSMTINVTGRWK